MGMASNRSKRGVLPGTATKLARARQLAERGEALKAIAKQVDLSESTLRRYKIRPQPAAPSTLITQADPRGVAKTDEQIRMPSVTYTRDGRQMQISAGDLDVTLDRSDGRVALRRPCPDVRGCRRLRAGDPSSSHRRGDRPGHQPTLRQTQTRRCARSACGGR